MMVCARVNRTEPLSTRLQWSCDRAAKTNKLEIERSCVDSKLPLWKGSKLKVWRNLERLLIINLYTLILLVFSTNLWNRLFQWLRLFTFRLVLLFLFLNMRKDYLSMLPHVSRTSWKISHSCTFAPGQLLPDMLHNQRKPINNPRPILVFLSSIS